MVQRNPPERLHYPLKNAVHTWRQLHIEDCRQSDVQSGAVLVAFCLSQFTHKRTLPRNANQMKNTTKPNLFSCQRDHQGLHIRHEYPHPLLPASPARRIGRNRSGKNDFKFLVGEVRYALWRRILELGIS